MNETRTNQVPTDGREAHDQGCPVDANPYDEHGSPLDHVNWTLWKWQWCNGLEFDRRATAECGQE